MTLNSIVLVTGATGGIGRALVARLKARDRLVAAVGRDLSRLKEVAADLHIEADTTTPQGAASAIDMCKTQWGLPPSFLAHAVGNTLVASLHRSREEQIRDVLRVNLESSLWMLQAWINGLNGSPGAAVFASSVVAQIGVANHEAIAAAKGGVEALVRSAAATYAAQGVRVNAVAPGLTETGMTAGMLKLPAMREAAGKQYPLGGIQTAQEVASVMDWLLSQESGRLTGQTLAVDGGFTTIRPLIR